VTASGLGTPLTLDEGQQTAVIAAVLARGYGSVRPADDQETTS
jgi:hypothetical protein